MSVLSVPANILAAIGLSYEMTLVAELTTGGEAHELPIVDYTVTADDSSASRYTVDLTLSPGVDPELLRPYGATLRCWHRCNPAGVNAIDVPAGVYRVVSRDLAVLTGELKVQGVGFEGVVERDKFTTPRRVASSSTLEAIKTLLRESIPDAEFDERATHDKSVPAITFDTERWGAIRGDDASLARSIGADVYFDARGRWRIQDSPTLNDPEVWECAESTGGTIVSLNDSISDEDVINVWVVTGARADGSPMARAVVFDDDTSSPTYALGMSYATGDRFGRFVGFLASPLLETNGQAERAGRTLLATSTGLSESLSLTSSPHPGLEVGDVIVTRAGSVTSRRIVSGITWTRGAMAVATRVVRRDYL